MNRIVTPKESATLEVFRSRIPDILAELSEFQRQDLWLLRWLRDKELSVDRAEKLLRKTIEWRKEFKMDSLFDIPIPEYIEKDCIIFVPGADKEGHLAAIINFGKFDLKKMVKKGLRNELIRFAAQILEKGLEALEIVTAKSGSFRYKFCLIFNMDGFSMSQVISRQVIGLYIECLNLFRFHYPETLKSAWFVNLPSFYEIPYRMVKPFVAAKTLARVHIHGKEGWRKEMLKEFYDEDLPSNLGGSLTTCPKFLPRYGFEHVLHRYENFPDDEFKPNVLLPNDKLFVSHHLLKGHRMSWNFRSDDVDVGYVVQFQRELMDQPKIMFECAHADSHLYLQKGGIVATDPGIYSLILENYEKSESKTIYCAIRVETDIMEFPPWAPSIQEIQKRYKSKYFPDENENSN